jgi:ferrous iron transport protein B
MDASIPCLALVGKPNSGKSSLFNALTGSRQKTANYPGVTVERRMGTWISHDGLNVEVVDLPGAYSLDPASPDEEVTRRVIMGEQDGQRMPDTILCVVDATALWSHLRFVLEIKQLGRPVLVALNMMDLAKRDGIEIDVEALSRELGVPVLPAVAVRRSGVEDFLNKLPREIRAMSVADQPQPTQEPKSLRELHQEAKRIAKVAVTAEGTGHLMTRQVDRVVLNAWAGPLILMAVVFFMFQAVYTWAQVPMGWIDASMVAMQSGVLNVMGDSWLRSLLVDGILAGVGSVVIFLPQILILFGFILALEQSGYMARAAFLMDRIMGAVGLSGRSFIPLLSSFACAVPGIMATRTIGHPRDRLMTIMIAPLMTCSARLPVYTVIIAAFIPARDVWGGIGLQGLVMFVLYLIGIASAMLVAWVFKLTMMRGGSQSFIMELPKYQWPQLRDLGLGLLQRAKIFIRRAGTIIMGATIVLWVLASYPSPPAGAVGSAVRYSMAGWIGRGLEYIFAPIGFNWEISIALVPGMAAREVAIASLGTIYSLGGTEDQVAQSLVGTLQGEWSLPTALAFVAWFVFAPQCLSTLAITRRETNSWRWPLFMFGYLFALAYVCAGITYYTASWLMA